MTKNRVHQDTSPCITLYHQAWTMLRGEGAKAPMYEVPNTPPTRDDAFTARPSSQTVNPPNLQQLESHQSHCTGPRCAAPLPAR